MQIAFAPDHFYFLMFAFRKKKMKKIFRYFYTWKITENENELFCVLQRSARNQICFDLLKINAGFGRKKK